MSVPALPVRWRPRRGRLVPHGLAAASLAAVIAVALLVPTFQPPDRVALVILGALVAVALYFFGRCELRAGPGGLTVVNVLRTTELGWAQVLDARMQPGEPWPTLDLADGTTIAAMGIQSTDGAHARQALAELRGLIAAHGETAEPQRPRA
jgi:PH (Pleckstrin Homology) domain-containing protein